MRRWRRCAAQLAALLAMVAGSGLTGCQSDEDVVATGPTGYAISYEVDVTAHEGATFAVQIEFLAADGDTASDAPTDFPWQGGDTGYAAGDTLWLRVHGTAACANMRGGVARSLRIWGSSPYDVPVDFGTDVHDRVVGEFDDVKTVILP